MTWTLWPRRLSTFLRGSRSRSRQGPHRGPARDALRVEELESRLLPSTLSVISAPVAAGGPQPSVTSGNGPSTLASLINDSNVNTSIASTVSADGRYILFLSDAANLVAGQVTRTLPDQFGLAFPTNPNVFLLDRTTNQVTLVSHDAGSPTSTADAGCFSAALSSDGSTVAFTSAASNLVPGSYQGESLYLWSRSSGTVTRIISSGANGLSPQNVQGISRNGQYILYSNTNSSFTQSDEYLYDTSAGTNTLIDHQWFSASPSPTNTSLPEAVLSDDGSTVAFVSTAPDLVFLQNKPPPRPPTSSCGTGPTTPAPWSATPPRR
jgi:hypothetical protein